MIELNELNLFKVTKEVETPAYDRQKIKTGILHIGIGGFHRAHQAYYIDELFQKFDVSDWGICGVALLEKDKKIFDILTKQNNLYTLIIYDSDEKIDARIIGSITELLFAPDNPEKVISKIASPDIKIVSLTITEGGYNMNSASGEFIMSNPLIQWDIANPNKPKTVFGYLSNALKLRAEQNSPLTILSCDNIQHNGDVTRRMLLSYIEKANPEIKTWVEKKVSFPNSMVDRITPQTSQTDIENLKNRYKIYDKWPVVTEKFKQWIIEDNFIAGRPMLEKVGAKFVSDVTPYEKMKLRLLNAGHSVLGIPGAIHGHKTIDACMKDQVFATFMRKFMDEEATPVLGNIEGIDLDKYKDTIEERFANPNIKDAVSRICSESSAKLPKFLIPTIKENLIKGGSIKYSAFVLASWCYYSDKEVNENNEPLEITDEKKTELHNAAKNTNNDKLSFLKQTDIFNNLSENKHFVKEYKTIIEKIYKEGNIRKIMAEMLDIKQ